MSGPHRRAAAKLRSLLRPIGQTPEQQRAAMLSNEELLLQYELAKAREHPGGGAARWRSDAAYWRPQAEGNVPHQQTIEARENCRRYLEHAEGQAARYEALAALEAKLQELGDAELVELAAAAKEQALAEVPR